MKEEIKNKYLILHGIRLSHAIDEFENYPLISTSYIALVSYDNKINDGYTRKEFYELTFHNVYGSCGSGYCSATWGYVTINKVNLIRDVHFKPTFPIENMICLLEEIGSNEDLWKLKLVISPDNPVLESTGRGGDDYYPSGYSEFNPEFFEKTERCVDKMRVYIFTGDSGLGKSYIGNMISNSNNVYETDIDVKLPSLLTSPFVILGNRSGFTVEDVKGAYKEVEQEIDFIEVNFR